VLPEPLHPAIVHFPIVFVALLPLVAIAALILLHRGRKVRPVWGWVVVLAVMLSASAWVSVETGEDQEDVVEDVIASEAPIHDHEEAAELFLFLTLGGLVVVGAGLAPGRLGQIARYAGTVGTFGLLAAGINTGHTGGELVYEHGAAQAYVVSSSSDGSEAGARRERDEHDDDDDDDDHDDDDDRRDRR